MKLESKNIYLRKSNMADCEYFAKWETSEEIAKHFAMSDDRDYEQIVRELVLAEKDETKLQLTIVLKETDKPIGRVLITAIDTYNDALDFSRLYIGDIENRGKGYAEDAARLVLEYAFMTLHTERVTLDHTMDSFEGEKLYKKLGFQNEGIARNRMKHNGKYYDLQVMSILRSEYYSKNR